MLLPSSIVLASDTLFEYYNTGDDGALTFNADLYDFMAQTFTASSSHTVTSVKLLLYRSGDVGDIYVYIYSTSGGHPNTLLRSNHFDGGTLTTSSSGEWKEITFTSLSLTSGTKYAVVIAAPSALGGDYLYIREDTSSPTYSGGNYERKLAGESWESITSADIMFEVYGVSTIVAPTVTTQAVDDITSTTATGNGTITATGGENCTKRGVAYSTTDTTPTIAEGADYEEETGSFSTGVFDVELTELGLGTTYYVRAYAYNSAGYGYGSMVQFTTSFTAPSIMADDASSITINTARLNSTILDDGGDTCEVRFGYGDDSPVAFDDYDTITDWFGAYTDGQHPYYDAGSLTADTTYYFSVQVRNDEDTDTSDEKTFDTLAAVNEPSNFKAIPSSTSIDLSWVKGVGASRTLVKYSFTNYDEETMFTSGIQLYFGSGSGTEHTGLSPGTIVYYWAWGEGDGTYSDGVSLSSVTTAGSSGSADVTAPPEPGNWFISTDYTTMSNFEPFFTAINNIADELGMPYNTIWMLAALIFCVLLPYAVFNFSSQNVLAAGVTMIICMAVVSAQHLIPLYVMFLSLVVLLGVSITRRAV
jgi:hypothetical protein